MYRTRMRRRDREASVAPDPVVHPPEVHPEVRTAVERLSVRQRAVVILAYWEDLTDQMIAEYLGISAGSVRRHLARARSRLRRVLDEFDEKQIVREVLESMASEAPARVSFENLTDTRIVQQPDPPRRSALVAAFVGFMMIVGVIGGAIAITQRSTPAGPSPTSALEDTVPQSLGSDTIYGVWEVIELDGAAPIGRPGVTFSTVPDVNASVSPVEPGQAGPGLAGPHFATFGLCNNRGGTYAVDGDRVHTQLSGGMTLRACSEEVSRQGLLFSTLLNGAEWSIADGWLTLTGDLEIVAVLREVDAPAVGVWRLAELDGNLPGSEISMDLSERGVVSGYAGCFILGTYVVEGDQLTMSIDAPAEEPNPPPPELLCDQASEEELQVVSLLREGRISATGDELRFTSDTGASAVFHRA